MSRTARIGKIIARDAFSYPMVPESCRLIAFKEAFVTHLKPGHSLLVVRGVAPTVSTRVFLSHREYRRRPDWWGIEVVGALPGGVCLKDDRHYEACISLAGLIGEMGIEVVGASTSMKLEL